MKNQFAKIVAVLMVLAMAVSVFSICAFAADTTEANVAILGDVNLDGRVTIQDATLIQEAIAKLATLDEVQTAVADANEDTNVNIKDATAIQKWIAKYADANQNIGQPLVSTPDESTPDQTPDESTPDQTPDESTTDESTADESTKDETEATEDEKPATKDEPATEDQPVVETVYYVAGVPELTGFNWDPAGAKMTNDGDGTWSITFTGIAAGTYEFKVTNGTWDLSYNLEGEAMGLGTNATVTTVVDDSTVIIGFDGTKAIVEFVTAAPATDDQPVVDPATKDEEPATKDEATTDEPAIDENPAVVLYVMGSFNSWTAGDAMTAYVDGTYTYELALTAGTYEYKVATSDWSVEYPSGYGQNFTLTVDADATYVFTFANGEVTAVAK